MRKLANVANDIDVLAAAASSGSSLTMGMIVAPCSMRSLGEIATGISSNLLTRAAGAGLLQQAEDARRCDRPHRRRVLDLFDLDTSKVNRWKS